MEDKVEKFVFHNCHFITMFTLVNDLRSTSVDTM